MTPSPDAAIEPSTPRSILLDHLRKYPALETSMRLIEQQIDDIEAEARAASVPPALDVNDLAGKVYYALMAQPGFRVPRYMSAGTMATSIARHIAAAYDAETPEPPNPSQSEEE